MTETHLTNPTWHHWRCFFCKTENKRTATCTECWKLKVLDEIGKRLVEVQDYIVKTVPMTPTQKKKMPEIVIATVVAWELLGK